jgi:acyl-CoA synthetase (NDP forming)
VPVVATFLGAAIDAPLASGAVRIPLFEFPNGAARALGRMADYGDWLAEPVGTLPEHDPAALDGARALVADILEEQPDGAWLDIDTASALLELCGLPMMPVPPGALGRRGGRGRPGPR